MGNKDKFFESLSADRKQADVWYKVYNISREKIELFHDFIMSLYDIVESTYLGNDVILTEFDQKKHFEWCWNKTIENFSKEKIFFKTYGEHYDYLWIFFSDAYYFNKENDEEIKIKYYIDSLFKYDFKKNRSELMIMTEIYKLLEQNLKT